MEVLAVLAVLAGICFVILLAGLGYFTFDDDERP